MQKKVTIRLSDEFWKQLSEYCEEVGADLESISNALVRSYIQTMIDTGDMIVPEFSSITYKRLVFDGPYFHTEPVVTPVSRKIKKLSGRPGRRLECAWPLRSTSEYNFPAGAGIKSDPERAATQPGSES